MNELAAGPTLVVVIASLRGAGSLSLARASAGTSTQRGNKQACQRTHTNQRKREGAFGRSIDRLVDSRAAAAGGAASAAAAFAVARTPDSHSCAFAPLLSLLSIIESANQSNPPPTLTPSPPPQHTTGAAAATHKRPQPSPSSNRPKGAYLFVRVRAFLSLSLCGRRRRRRRIDFPRSSCVLGRVCGGSCCRPHCPDSPINQTTHTRRERGGVLCSAADAPALRPRRRRRHRWCY